jgi:cysteine synthase B
MVPLTNRFAHGLDRPIGTTLLEQVGNTPLVRIWRIDGLPPAVELYAKLEGFNPGGSVKDRPVLRMIENAERAGLLPGPDGTVRRLLDSSSGNAGIAYAMIGAIKGYPVTLVVPANASEERKGIIRAYGAEIVLSDPLEGSDGAMRVAQEMAHRYPERYLYLNQYDNPGNWQAHYDGTGLEIAAQTHGRITHFVAALGTTGTLVGAGRRLREVNPRIEIVAVEPDSPLHGIEGLKHLPTAIAPGIYDPTVLHRTLRVSTEQAYTTARRLALEEGIFVGISAGAALDAALTVARDLSDGMVVVIFPDSGDRYLSTPLWTPPPALPGPAGLK